MKTKTKRYYIVKFNNVDFKFISMKSARFFANIVDCPLKEYYTKNSETYQQVQEFSKVCEEVIKKAVEYTRHALRSMT